MDIHMKIVRWHMQPIARFLIENIDLVENIPNNDSQNMIVNLPEPIR